MGVEIGGIQHDGLVAAVEQAADAVVVTDVSGNIQYVNRAFTALTGYSSEEAVGQPASILKSEIQCGEFYQALWNTIRSGGVWQGELINRRKDGGLYREEMHITPVREPRGEIVSFLAIKHEVTMRRTAAEEQSFLATIVESAEDAILACTPGGVIRMWNRGAENILGYPAGEAVGKPLSMLLAPERQAPLPRLIDRVLRGVAVPQYETICMHRDGRRMHASMTGSPMRNAAGEVVAISIILRDSSGRREAEQARAFLASIVESSDDAICGVKLDGTILSWNRGAESLFGYSSQEVTGKNMVVLATPGRYDEVRRCLATIRKGRAIPPFEAVLRKKDGHGVDVSLAISPIHKGRGEVAGGSHYRA